MKLGTLAALCFLVGTSGVSAADHVVNYALDVDGRTDAAAQDVASPIHAGGREGVASILKNPLPSKKRVFAIAVSTNSAKVDLAQVDCLTLDPKWAHVDRIDHSDDAAMRNAVAAYLQRKLSNDPTCRFLLRWTVIHEKTFAVRYQGRPSVTLMSFGICEKPLGPTRQQCLSKNVWLFDKIVSAVDEYALGIKAFVSPSSTEWVVVNVSLDDK